MRRCFIATALVLSSLMLPTATFAAPAPQLMASPATGTALTGAALTGTGVTNAASLKVSQTPVDITVRDGARLKASVWAPTSGQWPVVIMPGTFAGDNLAVDLMARKVAPRGYIVISYTERGFGDSTGQVDAAGPRDVADASDVLDWALANTNAMPSRAGIASLSYGAGFIPMVLAQDHRFKAGAMLSGWGDMLRSLRPNDTTARAAVAALKVLADIQDPSPETSAFFKAALADDWSASTRRFAEVRSPMTYLGALKSNPAPLYMSTTFNEMIWPLDQTIDFYEAYPGVKHLDIVPGDHATTEVLTAIDGTPVTWQTAFDWFDTYLAGRSNAARSLPPIRVASRGADGPNIVSTKSFTNYDFETPSSLTGSPNIRQYLSTTSSWWGWGASTVLSDRPGNTSTRLQQGTNAVMTAGLPMYQGLGEAVTGQPSSVTLPLVDRRVTGVWTGEPLSRDSRIRGTTRVHLDLTPTTSTGSAFVYLIDQPPFGSARVIAHKPYSYRAVTPGRANVIDLTIPYQAYDIPRGHRLVVAVSTDDVFYSSLTPKGSSMKIGPGSYIDVPLS